MKTIHVLLVYCLLVLLFSCKKDLSSDSNVGREGFKTVNGNWKFIGMHAKTTSIVEMNDGTESLKTITISEYYTKKNTGTVSFDDTKVTGSNFSYEVDTVAKAWIYENDVLIDSVLAPFTVVSPSTNSMSTYTKVSHDSITVTGGQFSGIGGSTPSGQPTGIKLRFEGNNVLMTIKAYSNDLQQSGGVQQTKKQSVTAVMTYQRI